MANGPLKLFFFSISSFNILFLRIVLYAYYLTFIFMGLSQSFSNGQEVSGLTRANSDLYFFHFIENLALLFLWVYLLRS
jgi:hypothetical protein